MSSKGCKMKLIKYDDWLKKLYEKAEIMQYPVNKCDVDFYYSYYDSGKTPMEALDAEMALYIYDEDYEYD
jgi:hypothetical protein